jgi:quercetin dioxygenase-like cupin family protein
MQTIIHEIGVQKKEKTKMIDATMVNVNLPHFINLIKEEDAWKQNDRNTITLLKTSFLRIILIALHKGAVIKKRVVPQMVSVHVLEGRMIFTTDVQTVELKAGDMIALYDAVAHSVEATEDTVFLLTLTSTHHN